MAVAFDTPAVRTPPRSYPVPMPVARPEAKKPPRVGPPDVGRVGLLRLAAAAQPQPLRGRAGVLVHRRDRHRQVAAEHAASAGSSTPGTATASTRSPAPHDPLFVLGHWRTGTTLLHELLILDDRHTYPTTHDCFEPCHYLLSARLLPPSPGVPAPRPPADGQHGLRLVGPQEDEFALALLGQPSTYTDFAFPNRPPLDPGALDLSGLTPRELRAWKRAFRSGSSAGSRYRDPRRLVLKSPPHTARIPVLLELFPKAKFVHIRRDPYTLFASTVNLWMRMGQKHGLQTPRGGPDAGREGVPRVPGDPRAVRAGEEVDPGGAPGRGAVRGPGRGLRRRDAAGVRRARARRVRGGDGRGSRRTRRRGYERNRYTIDDQLRAKIKARWGDAISAQGYA